MMCAGNTVWAVPFAPELIGACVYFIAPLILGTVVIVWAARRFKRPPEERLTPDEELARYHALEEEGELSPEELERIRALLDASSAEAPPVDRPATPPDAFKPGEPPL
jgi:hypothetical protein